MIIHEWATHIIDSDFSIFDSKVIERAKDRVIDMVGCIIGGANAPGSAMILDQVKEWGGTEQATVLFHGIKAPACNAAMVNAIMGRSFDFGPIVPYVEGKPSIAHISETSVPTALTMGEWKHISGRELLTTLILSDDITARLNAASKYTPGVSWDCTGTVDRFGATAIAGRLMGLSRHQLVHAFGIILNQLAGSFQSIEDGTHTFILSQGLSARDGIIAAELARRGWTGCDDPLLGKYGYFAIYSRDYNEKVLTKDLGKKFYADDIFKTYPCCGCMQTPILCSLNIVRENEMEINEIDEITIDICPVHLDSPVSRPFMIGEFPQGNANFNLRYNVANALVRKDVKLEHFTEKFIRDPLVGQIASKARVIATQPLDKVWAAAITVKMKDGRVLSGHIDTLKGDPIASPISRGEIEDKFKKNFAFSKMISGSNVDKALDILRNLEEVDDMAVLTRFLVV